MAKEADNLVLRLLREIRGTQHEHGKKFDELERDAFKLNRRLAVCTLHLSRLRERSTFEAIAENVG